MGLRIVPVGLIYERKQRARSRAYVRIGEPIAMDEDLATNPSVPTDESDRAAVAALTERIRSASPTRRSTIRARSSGRTFGWPRTSPFAGSTGTRAVDRPMGEVERLADRLSEAPARIEEEVRAAAGHYRDGLAVIGVPDAVVAPGAEEALARRGLFAWLLALAVPPLALVGLVANAPPSLAVYAAGRRPAPPVRHATIKFLAAFVVFPLMWAVLRWWVFDDARYAWLLTLAVGPICGLATLWCVGRLLRARRGGWGSSGWQRRQASLTTSATAAPAWSRPSALRRRRRRTARKSER